MNSLRFPTSGRCARYRLFFTEIEGLWVNDRVTVKFLVASALFRDGLTGVFTFGAIITANVYGLSEDDVLIFGVAANVVAAAGAMLTGTWDDRSGPCAVIGISLVSMLAVGTALFMSTAPWRSGCWACSYACCRTGTGGIALLPSAADPDRQGGAELWSVRDDRPHRNISRFLAPTAFGLLGYIGGADR